MRASGRQSSWSDEDLLLLFDMLADGHTYDAIADRFGRSRGAITGLIKRLRDEGIEIPPYADD